MMNIRLEVAGAKCCPPQRVVRHHAGVSAIVVVIDEGVAIAYYQTHGRGVGHPHARVVIIQERMTMMMRGA